MFKHLLASTLLLFSQVITAETLPFDLHIKGESLDVTKSLQLSDIGEGKTEINFKFSDNEGKAYEFDLKYKALPSNRSYPTNLDITLKNGDGEKLGYLFFANNGVAFLKQMGKFGLIIDVDGKPVDIQFVFDADKKGSLALADLTEERFVQDTLVPKWNFQMIRPVIMPLLETGLMSQTYALDDHPFTINYSIKAMDNGLVEFQHNLYEIVDNKEQLRERIYFQADRLETLREAMYAGKYFDKENGTFKLVFYPAMGQTQPPKK